MEVNRVEQLEYDKAFKAVFLDLGVATPLGVA